MDIDDVIALLRQRIQEEGASVTRFAMNHGLSQSYLSNVLNGNNKPGPAILVALDLKPVLSYEPIKK